MDARSSVERMIALFKLLGWASIASSLIILLAAMIGYEPDPVKGVERMGPTLMQFLLLAVAIGIGMKCLLGGCVSWPWIAKSTCEQWRSPHKRDERNSSLAPWTICPKVDYD